MARWKTGMRRWLRPNLFRFSLRTMLIAITVAAIWGGRTVNGVVAMRRAAAYVEDVGGKVFYHYEPGSSELTRVRRENDRRRWKGMVPLPVTVADPPGPEWLRVILGDDYFRQVKEVQFFRSQVEDKDLKRLGPLRELVTISLPDAKITDAGLETLGSFPRLEVLRLQGTKITDVSLNYIARYRRLKTVDLTGTTVSIEAIQELQKQLPNVEIYHSAK